MAAVCPLGLNQICHLTLKGDRFITVSESRDSKGTIYHTSAVLSPNDQSQPDTPVTTAGDIKNGGRRDSVSSEKSAVSQEPSEVTGKKCSLAALTRHGKKFVVVALRGQIWFTEINNQPSSEVCFLHIFYCSFVSIRL